MASEYPLSVVSMDDLGYFSRGHHDPEVFLEIVRRMDGEVQGEMEWEMSDVIHEWWRNDPVRRAGSPDVQYMRTDGPGCGAFPVTVVYI